ncbi:hypothetical protein M404DRAFT_482990 [Pisolithus tinctorius Marx 270]|uniref:Uncharacterized protein n=1 Tax=Pisolithus tinctorius Marx 270 TaxID=870435 RepID=A0A0C3PEY4_PISTI|nr:hypothetical protein M404DRAFT_482990 [Pisolithus tinctorius Marx 270]
MDQLTLPESHQDQENEDLAEQVLLIMIPELHNTRCTSARSRTQLGKGWRKRVQGRHSNVLTYLQSPNLRKFSTARINAHRSQQIFGFHYILTLADILKPSFPPTRIRICLQTKGLMR